MAIPSFAELDSPERLRSILAARGYFPEQAPADKLFDLPPDQRSLMHGAQIVALAGPAHDDNTLVVLWVPRSSLPLDLLRRIRRRLAENTRDGLVFCAQNWQNATLYLLRQEDIPQSGQAQPTSDKPPTWEVNFGALRPADRQGLEMLDIRAENPYDLSASLLRAFRRAERETIYQNQGLFSNYYLNERLAQGDDPHSVAWRELAASMPALQPQIEAALGTATEGLDLGQTEAAVIRPLLAALGWKFDTKSAKGQLDLRVDGTTIAFCHTLPWGAALDVAPVTTDPLAPLPSPDMQLIGRLSGQKSVLWGILTNGRTWRLISRQATSTSGVFYEIDLRDLLEVGAPDHSDLRWFAAFFSAAWLRAPSAGPGLLDLVYQSGQLWAEQLGNDLKAAIFKDVFVDFANALAEGVRRAGDEPDLRTVYRATLVLLYRLLFVLYAESRRLLPLNTPGYYPNSLTYMLSTLALKQNGLIQPEPGFSLQTDDPRLWLKLRALFQAIGLGNAAWNVPHYNGGLFADDTSPAHALLIDLDAVANDYLAKGLDRLARDDDARGATGENEALRLIDYMDLDVRRLGSIYEGLLEFQLRRAEQDGEVIDGRLAAVATRRGRKSSGRLVQAGEVYLETTRQDRKASGSYYTPDYIVRYIVEQTVGPVLEQRELRFGEEMSRLLKERTELRRAEQRLDNPRYSVQDYNNQQKRVRECEDAAIDVLLDIKVLDPAMGSGHFLVAAVNYLSDQIIAILERHRENPLLPRLAEVRAAIRKNLDEQGISGAVVPDEQLRDTVLLRRMVMKRCIYGVDLNDMAVELAKLSLWLDSFAVGAPLSFLDHHLRWGNSLIGIWDVEKSILPNSTRWSEFMRALGYMVQITRLTDSTNAEVQTSRELYDQAQKALQPFRERFNVDLGHQFTPLGTTGQLDQARRVAHTPLTQRAGAHAAESIAKFKIAQGEAEARHFFHWKIEFPEVFVDHERSDWKADNAAGFDAVVGNPPYGFIKSVPGFHKLPPDIFVYFWFCCMRIGRHGASLSLITPSSWLTGVSFLPLRSMLLSSARLDKVITLPYDMFKDAYIDTCIVVIQKGIPQSEVVRVYKMKNSDDINIIFHLKLRSIDIQMWDHDENKKFVLEVNNKSVFRENFIMKMGEIIEVERGVQPYSRIKHSDDLINSDFLRFFGDIPPDVKYMPELLGEELSRYTILPNKKIWLEFSDRLASKRDKKFFTQQRIVLRRLLSRRRELMSAVTSDNLITTDNILNIILTMETYNSFFISGLLNSRYIAWKYTQNSAISVKDDFPQVTYQELGQLPLRRIHFTTPIAERQQLTGEVSTLAAGLIADERGLPLLRGPNGWPRYEATAYHASPLGQRMAALLPQDAQGAFLAFAEGATGAEEHSDVVHDLLAELAGQMIDLNKRKQAEIKRFLGWLEVQLDITADKDGRGGIDSLPNKTTLQNYLGDYQKNEDVQPWESIYGVLHKNRKRIVNIHLLADMFRPQLQAEYEHSLATLRPLKARLARTDALIDQIVYQLYGLTPAEIMVVEGN